MENEDLNNCDNNSYIIKVKNIEKDFSKYVPLELKQVSLSL